MQECHKSSVLKNFFVPGSSSPPPSGSTASIHRAIAIVCFTSFELIHTLPFTPTATSRGNREPRSGRRKCFGSKSLFGMIKDVRLVLDLGDLLSTHQKTTTDHETPLQLAKFSCFPSLGIKTFKLGFHIFMREGNARIYQRVDLLRYTRVRERRDLSARKVDLHFKIGFIPLGSSFKSESIQ